VQSKKLTAVRDLASIERTPNACGDKPNELALFALRVSALDLLPRKFIAPLSVAG
jgi:hypothetical protein